MKLEVLLSVMNLNIKDLDKMNITTKCTVINQSKIEGFKKYKNFNIYSYKEKGLANSRNRGLEHITEDIAILCDDDVVYNNEYEHKETYYSQRVLPGNSLAIPGRHVADDGTVRDGEGYISVAADPSYLPKGSTIMTSMGPAKVYDTGCAYGTIDIYVNW